MWAGQLWQFHPYIKKSMYCIRILKEEHRYLDLENWIRLLHQLCSAVVGNEVHDGTQFD